MTEVDRYEHYEEIRIRITTMDDDEYYRTKPLRFTQKELEERKKERQRLYPEEDKG